jgi:hypothetical protein
LDPLERPDARHQREPSALLLSEPDGTANDGPSDLVLSVDDGEDVARGHRGVRRDDLGGERHV